jgi:hypothetical protein
VAGEEWALRWATREEVEEEREGGAAPLLGLILLSWLIALMDPTGDPIDSPFIPEEGERGDPGVVVPDDDTTVEEEGLKLCCCGC